ncbi:MAG TPA: hypothetical protein VHL54_07610 [Actinomycetota bacterium]|nr:hypothetical protein [Actinomycetota bacterium]
MDPQLTQVSDQLQLIMLHSQASMDPDQAQAFAAAASQIQGQYDDAVAVLGDKNASAADQKLAKDVTDSINKNLPNLTKGVLSAASAFKSGDYINGSAAIMDICAAGVQMLASLSAGAGPYGAVFGAIFSIVGQLLTYFGPKQPSLKDQIIEAIRGMDADSRLQTAQADGDAVEEFTATVYRVRSSLPKNLQLPLETTEDLRQFEVAIGADVLSIKTASAKVSVLYDKWGSAEWLKDKKTQDLEKWPEILGVFCRTYSDSLLANMAVAALPMVNKKLITQRLDDVSQSNPRYKDHPEEFAGIHHQLMKLLTTVRALPDVWNDGNAKMLQTLRELKPVAQYRGLYVHLNGDQYLYGATGRSKLLSETWKYLPLGYGARGHRFSITVAQGDAGSLAPQHDIFFCESWKAPGGDIVHGKIKPSSVEIFDRGSVTGDKFSDVWALPAPRDHDGATFVYAAHENGAGGYVKLFELDAKNQPKDGNWSPNTKSGVVNVRVVTHPPSTLPDDPDRDGMPPGSQLLGGVNHYNSITYGALRSSSEIYVDQSNTRCYVPSPWGTYSGIDVDPYYVWVFRPQGFACATHASVISCIQGKRTAPRWMEHSPTGLLGDQSTHDGNFWLVKGQEKKPAPDLVGVRSLSPCQDGTLFASIETRVVDKRDNGDHWVFTATDSPGLYTTGYSIDLKAGGINLGSWEKCGNVGRADQVQKMAISSWSLFESLNKDLQLKLQAQT